MTYKTTISELWPHVASVKIRVHQIYRSEFGLHEDYTPMYNNAYCTAEFHFKCINRECKGFFDLNFIIISMCNKHEENREGTLYGHCNELKDFDSHCKCRLEYCITIEYSDNN